ncbi:transcriptional regulator, MarR family [Sphingomonas sp. OK281]|nr:transcriptional regulator, MarR family [Sphingomonas sp. OK281]
MVDTATLELAKRGHPDVRANHEFAMRAIQGGTDSAVALAGKLRITKQAAAKTIATLEARGYVTRAIDAADGRRRPLLLTSHGQDMLAQGQAILDDLRRTWAEMVGGDRLADVERVLRTLVGGPVDVIDAGAWLATE